MAVYNVPQPKSSKMDAKVAKMHELEPYVPTLHLTVSKAICDELKVGTDAEVAISGKVTSLEIRQETYGDGKTREECSVCIKPKVIQTIEKSDFDDLMEDGD